MAYFAEGRIRRSCPFSSVLFCTISSSSVLWCTVLFCSFLLRSSLFRPLLLCSILLRSCLPETHHGSVRITEDVDAHGRSSQISCSNLCCSFLFGPILFRSFILNLLITFLFVLDDNQLRSLLFQVRIEYMVLINLVDNLLKYRDVKYGWPKLQ